MTSASTTTRPIKPRKEVKLVVRYASAAKPFRDDNAAFDETVGDLKRRVLRAFGLSDGGDPTVYRLFHDRAMLDNEAMSLEQIEGSEGDADRELVLRLAQQVTQG